MDIEERDRWRAAFLTPDGLAVMREIMEHTQLRTSFVTDPYILGKQDVGRFILNRAAEYCPERVADVILRESELG